MMEIRSETPRLSKHLGIGAPFARRWSPILALGLLVYAAYRLLNPLIVGLFPDSLRLSYGVPVYYGPAAILLLTLFALHRWVCFPDLRFVGTLRSGDVRWGILAVSVLYLSAYGVMLLIGLPREPTMVGLYLQKTQVQIVVLVFSLVLLPPIVEELAFRHFLLSLLPFNANRAIAIIATVATAFFFSWVHSYEYLNTYVLLFGCGIVFAAARIRSNGMVLPIALHSYAIVFALVCDQVVARLGY